MRQLLQSVWRSSRRPPAITRWENAEVSKLLIPACQAAKLPAEEICIISIDDMAQSISQLLAGHLETPMRDLVDVTKLSMDTLVELVLALRQREVVEGLSRRHCTVSALVPKAPGELEEHLDTLDGEEPDKSTYKHQASYRARFAYKRGMEQTEYENVCQDHIEKLMDGAVVWQRCGVAGLEGLLRDGRLKSQHETHSSEGFLNEETRKRFEDNFLGCDATMPKEDRPIFGYLSDEDDRDGRGCAFGPGCQCDGLDSYGRIAIRFKDAVRDRSTMTFRDSLSNDWVGSAYVQGRRELVLQKASPVNVPDMRSFRFEERDPLEIGRIRDEFPYVEAQIYGQAKVSDVAEIVFHSQCGYDLYCDELAKAGIKHRLAATARDAQAPLHIAVSTVAQNKAR